LHEIFISATPELMTSLILHQQLIVNKVQFSKIKVRLPTYIRRPTFC